MYATNYAKASNVTDAVAKLATADDGKLLAGGQTLLPTLKQRLASPDQLIDLAGCGLSSISTSSGAIKIGAMTCHADVANHKDVATANPGLASLAGGIGDRQVRNVVPLADQWQTMIRRLVIRQRYWRLAGQFTPTTAILQQMNFYRYV